MGNYELFFTDKHWSCKDTMGIDWAFSPDKSGGFPGIRRVGGGAVLLSRLLGCHRGGAFTESKDTSSEQLGFLGGDYRRVEAAYAAFLSGRRTGSKCSGSRYATSQMLIRLLHTSQFVCSEAE